MDLTDTAGRALAILRDHGPLTPAQFARRMWPDSKAWRLSSKCGNNGSHRGGRMYTAAGGFLGKLRNRGLVADTNGWASPRGYGITKLGLEVLAENFRAPGEV